MVHISSDEIKQPNLHADTLGFTFVWQGHFLRGIYPESVNLAKSYFESGFIDEVVSKELFPKTWISEYENEQFGMIIEHEMISPVLYATEWNSAMLKDAALMVLDIAEIGWKYGYNMVDCHKLNVMFRNNQPVYVDLGSFVQREKGCTGWKPYKNFLESYTYILDMWTHGCPQIAKRMMSPGVKFNTEDYLSWKRPLYRVFPRLMLLRLTLRNVLNSFSIMGEEKGGGMRMFVKRIINMLKPAASQHFYRLRRGVERLQVSYTPVQKTDSFFDFSVVGTKGSIMCVNIPELSIINDLRCVGVAIISLHENDKVSNSEYIKNKGITSVSYPLMNGGVLVRGKFPENRLKSDVVLAYCKNGSHGQFTRHNSFVYLERCMEYSITGTMYVMLAKPDEMMVDLLREKWGIKRISDDGTQIEVNQSHKESNDKY